MVRTHDGHYYQGDMCYGMHPPWFCTHPIQENGGSFTCVLEHGSVSHWALLEEFEQEILRGGP
jgi:hypothetical protein